MFTEILWFEDDFRRVWDLRKFEKLERNEKKYLVVLREGLKINHIYIR